MKQETESPHYENYEREQTSKDCVRFLHIRQQRKKRKVKLQLPLTNELNQDLYFKNLLELLSLCVCRVIINYFLNASYSFL